MRFVRLLVPCSLQFMDRLKAEVTYAGGVPAQLVEIGIPAAAFDRYAAGVDGKRQTSFRDMIGRSAYRTLEQEIDPTAALLVRQLMQVPYSSAVRNIFVESKALELLSLAMGSLLFEQEPGQAAPLSLSDMEKVRQARDVLLHRMDNPPSFMELARMSGLSEYKLKVGFKAMFGATAFGYLRDKRLEKAMMLLQRGEMNVTEAALVVGYANPGYFAETFRSKYGVNPSELVRPASSVI